jgi:hypothetical protein
MFGQSYCFWEFTNTDLKYILIASCGTNCDMGVERILTPPPQHLQLLLETCVFFRSGLRACYGVAWKRMVLPKQLKKMKLTSFEFSLLEIGKGPDELSQRHAPSLSLASVCVAKPNNRLGPMPWQTFPPLEHKHRQAAAL